MINGLQSKVFPQLIKELKKIIKDNPKLKIFLYDSFFDHQERYKYDLDLFSRNFRSGKVLDVGASPFHLMYCLKQSGIDITGVDVNPGLLTKFIDKHKLLVKKCNIETEKLPFKNNSFDFIIFNEVFEHLRINPIFALKEINRVLKPEGVLLLTTPNLYAIHKIFMFNLGLSINDAYYEFNQLNIYGYVGHIREYSTGEIKRFLENTNFRVERVIYLNPYSFFRYDAFKNNIILRLAGLIIDILMKINPYWRRNQAIIAKK